MDLSRFSRSEMLIGGESVERLSRCHVAVFGLGGVALILRRRSPAQESAS